MIYPAAKVILHHPARNNEILLVRRYVNGKQYYEPAGGKVDVNFDRQAAETFEECAIREVHEELGVKTTLTAYLGSYYFFWSIMPNTCSICTVFSGTIVSYDDQFVTNADVYELTIEPVWVKLNDILKGSVQFDPMFVGLHDMMVDYCSKQLMRLPIQQSELKQKMPDNTALK